MRFSLLILLIAATAGGLAAPGSAAAQDVGETKVKHAKPKTAAPCCAVAAVNLKTQTVTARELSSGYTFKFKVSDRKVLASLKVGEKVWADLTKNTVRLKKYNAAPCCSVIRMQSIPEGGA